jgi:hypothetical protein
MSSFNNMGTNVFGIYSEERKCGLYPDRYGMFLGVYIQYKRKDVEFDFINTYTEQKVFSSVISSHVRRSINLHN